MITITKYELEKIKAIGNLTTERIMYVLLVLAKHHSTDTFYTTRKDILKYSKCNLDNDRLGEELHKLNQIGYVTTNLGGSRTVNIIDDISEVVLIVEELDEMVHAYLKTCKLEGYIFCSKCSKKVKQMSNRQKFCSTCSLLQKRVRDKNSIENARKNKVVGV